MMAGRFSQKRRVFLGFCAASAAFSKASMAITGSSLDLSTSAPFGADLDSWFALRPQLFGEKEILDGTGKISLTIPKYPQEGGHVPVKIGSSLPQNKSHYIKKHTLIVDDNPSPVAAVIELTPKNGKADISSMIRVDSFTFVRVISELNDGSLLMTAARVYVAGGCSGAALAGSLDVKALKAIEDSLGNMELRHGDVKSGEPTEFTFKVSHPNFFHPAYFITDIKIVTDDNETVLVALGDVSFSQNPEITFYYTLNSAAKTFKATVSDSKNLVFTNQWRVSATI